MSNPDISSSHVVASDSALLKTEMVMANSHFRENLLSSNGFDSLSGLCNIEKLSIPVIQRR
jgi:hypothetical protein